MIRSLVLLNFFLLAASVVSGQQSPTQSEWNQYFNAIFLPEESAESEKALRGIENTQLDKLAHQEATYEEKRSRESSTMSKRAVSADDAGAPATEDAAGRSLIAPALLPQVIESAEKQGLSHDLKGHYERYRAEYPLHSNVYGYGRIALNAVSPDGWLVVNGHLDTYPLRALQINENIRPDVTIVNLDWLKNDLSYRQMISGKLPENPGWTADESATVLIQKLQDVIPGKVHLSLTLPAPILKSFSDDAKPVGVVLRLNSKVSTAAKHHQLLSEINWNEVTADNLPAYVQALQQNYLAALLIDAKLGQPEKLGSHNRQELLESLYKQRNIKSAAKKYLKSE